AHDHALKGTFRHNTASYFFFARVCAAMVLMRAMSRRASRSREVFSSCPVARWKRRLKRSFFRLRTASSLWSSLIARMSSTFIGAMTLLRNARDEARLDRQLGGGERERFLRGLHGHAVDLEQHPARLDPRHPQFRRTLARAHADFGRLLRHRNVREDADPDPAGALHVTGQRAARGFDLAGGNALGRHRLQAELTERQRRARSRGAVDAALVRLPELRFLWLHHGLRPQTFSIALSSVAARTGIVALGHLLVLGHRIVLEDFALEDPDLDAAGAERRERGGNAIIDVGAQRVQRHPAFAIPLHPGDFGAAETARAVDTNA